MNGPFLAASLTHSATFGRDKPSLAPIERLALRKMHRPDEPGPHHARPHGLHHATSNAVNAINVVTVAVASGPMQSDAVNCLKSEFGGGKMTARIAAAPAIGHSLHRSAVRRGLRFPGRRNDACGALKRDSVGDAENL